MPFDDLTMYCEAFNLKEKPFSLAADPRYLYMSRQHWEAMAHLMYGVDDDWGFVLITGEIGTGKTTLCSLLLQRMPSDVEVAFLINPRLTVQELLISVCDEFRIEHASEAAGTKELFDLISAYLLEVHARAHKALLIIDEAQCLSSDVIDQLRLLTNLETAGGKLLRIILIGQPELRDKLAQPELEQMSQRITARYHLGPLSQKDVAAYVSHRMTLAGAQKEFFTRSALRALSRLSRGVPRLINVICDRALLGACMKREEVVSSKTMIQAGREVLRGTDAGTAAQWLGRFRWPAVGIAAGIVATLTFLMSYQGLMPNVMTSALPLKAAGRAASPRVPDLSWWPAGLGPERSKDAAYKGLLQMKGLSYDSSGSLSETEFCVDMELLDLQCMDRLEPSRDIRSLPVPAVLKLSDGLGDILYVTLQSVRGDKALLRIGDAVKEVDIPDIQSRWKGQHTTLEISGHPSTVKRKISSAGSINRKG